MSGKGLIQVDASSLNRVVKELSTLEKQMPEAASSALNRTLSHVNTQIGKMVTAEYAIKSGDVKKTIKKYSASKTKLSAGLVSKGRTMSLAHFSFTPKTPGTKKAVKVKIKKTGGKKEIRTDPKAFVALTGAKSEGGTQYNVFKRVGDERLPIEVIRTLSVPQMVGNKKVEEAIQEAAQKKLSERIEHEIKYRLDKAANNISR